MHTNSIQTEYYDENDQDRSINYYPYSIEGGSFKKQTTPQSSNVALRIQENIKEYLSEIKKNKDIVHQLQCQRKFFQKLSKKQKEKIEQIDIQKIRSSYQAKILQIKKQSAQLHEVIATYHEQQLLDDDSYKNAYSKIYNNKQFLMQTLIQLEKENQQKAQQIAVSQKSLKKLKQEIEQNDKLIKEKEIVHRKYITLQIQIEKLQRKISSPKKKQ